MGSEEPIPPLVCRVPETIAGRRAAQRFAARRALISPKIGGCANLVHLAERWS